MLAVPPVAGVTESSNELGLLPVFIQMQAVQAAALTTQLRSRTGTSRPAHPRPSQSAAPATESPGTQPHDHVEAHRHGLGWNTDLSA